jgi:tyrosine-protein kinase Etk/Wzc
VLVVDADLRRRLHNLFGIAREPGLVDVLTGAVRLEEALVSLPGHRVLILPAGATTQPAELLGRCRCRRLLEQLRSPLDRIVIDSTVAHTADTGAIEAAVDGVMLVVLLAAPEARHRGALEPSPTRR